MGEKTIAVSVLAVNHQQSIIHAIRIVWNGSKILEIVLTIHNHRSVIHLHQEWSTFLVDVLFSSPLSPLLGENLPG